MDDRAIENFRVMLKAELVKFNGNASQFAKKIGISKGFLSEIINGKKDGQRKDPTLNLAHSLYIPILFFFSLCELFS